MSTRTAVKRLLPDNVRSDLRRIERLMHLPALWLTERPRYTCPICSYSGKFLDGRETTTRLHATCPRCGAFERHRLQYCVLEELLADFNPEAKAALHFAPERMIRSYLRPRFGTYHTADLDPHGVDFQADMRELPFEDQSYDLVYASHVLEHIDDDRRAIAEIRRILKPGGVALLPVPIIGPVTVEYPSAVPAEYGHVRAPGADYFERYRPVFSRVEVKTSENYPDRFQLYIWEDRTKFSAELFPYRPSVPGQVHREFVPLCFA